MKTLFYSAKDFEQPYIDKANAHRHKILLIPQALSADTVFMANGYETISIFVNDDASTGIIEQLSDLGVKNIAIRATGYDNVDIEKANLLGIKVANVPEYSPNAIAEYTIALILALNRKLLLANEQVHKRNFTVGNLIGFDLNGKTVGIIGTGKIGSVVAKILHGFGCKLLGYDINEDKSLIEKYGLQYVGLEKLCQHSDIITLHTDLNEHTHYLIDREAINYMKNGVMLINTSRGGVINTIDLIEALENKKVSCVGLDVYEKERGIFFYNYAGKELKNVVLKKLLAMPNVLITPHQAFATVEALSEIASTTFYNLDCWYNNCASINELGKEEAEAKLFPLSNIDRADI